VHITPDQKFLYASNYDSQPYSGIAIFRRDSKTGVLTQLSGKEGRITSSGLTNQSKTTMKPA
jgi:6-phosphogluconolactonase (cycloisomerase 2 family)